MSKMNRSLTSFDEFCYEEDPVFCHCGVQASRRISHTAQNPNRKFFRCSNYKSKGDKGCSYFEWFDEKSGCRYREIEDGKLGRKFEEPSV
ncbi:hypothetical protein LINGRAHAP2_LOCUS13926 [Linum grandiflorum]